MIYLTEETLTKKTFGITFVFLTIFIVGSLFIGCGGGIRGTGGIEPTNVTGKLLNLDGNGIEGATIIVLESGDETITGPGGEFEIETELSTGELSLAVQTVNIDTTISLGTVPIELTTVIVTLELNNTNNSITVVSTNIPPAPVTQITPTPSGSNGGGPAPTPGQVPTEDPDPNATKVPDPIVTATPLPTPTHTPAPTSTPMENTYRGTVVNAYHTPLPNGRVEIVDTGDYDNTDLNGFFLIKTDPLGGDITIKFGTRDGSPKATIRDVPSTGGLLIDLVLKIRILSDGTTPTIVIESVEISN